MQTKCWKERENFSGGKALTIPIMQFQAALTQLCNTMTKAATNSTLRISILLLRLLINPSCHLKKLPIDSKASLNIWLIKRRTTRII